MSKITIKKIQSFKNKKTFCAITAYDFSTAKIIDEVEDIIPFNRSVQRTPNMENSSSTPRKDRILVMQNLK